MNSPSLRIRYVAASMRQSGYGTCERLHCIKNDVKQTWSVIKDTFKRNCIVHHKFILNNNTITDLGEIATELN